MWIFGFSDLQQHSLTEKQASALLPIRWPAPVQFVGRMQQGIAYAQSGKLRIQAPETCRADATAAPQRHDPTAGPCADDDPGALERKTITIIRSAVHCPAETLHWPTTVYCITKRAFACGFNLPQTAVETDSFVAVQLLQKLWRGDTADHCCYGRTVGGTFTFSDFRK